MDNVQRKKLINTLNRQRNRLKGRGAHDVAIGEYFGGLQTNQRFSNLSDSELLRAAKIASRQPQVEVLRNGAIVRRGYQSRLNAHYDNPIDIKVTPNTLQRSQQSKLLNYQNTRQIKTQRNKAQKASIKKYVDQLEHIGADQATINRIKKMKPGDFFNFIESAGGKLDFEEVFMYDVNEATNGDMFIDQSSKVLGLLKRNLRRSRF